MACAMLRRDSYPPHPLQEKCSCYVLLPTVMHPRGSYIVHPLLSQEVATPDNNSIHWTLSSICESASKAVLSRMQLTLRAARPTLHGASPLVQEMSAWSVKTRRGSSRHCRDARVNGHTTTAMHDMSTLPSPHSERSALPSICKKVASQTVLSKGCSSPSMRLADHLTTLRAWCTQCLPGR